ncbi:MAG: SDR family oxidoreductase [Geminicoccaceae bacterium]|nr:SDR family oxidoreductase [Geminicoccaceae bacterium]MCS7267361.1 SDR family oxidoreductase [Geminicoccaceae bacterium]MDW8123584.1 SDR family oxidoreductase [Geminicoccaceae bacterium]MDW8339925.1 SDR family oxidoreductase [Geminicoccaceae bacterium]
MRLLDKIAIVTGAARGIGRATARRFLEEGARVVMADRDLPALEAAARAMPAPDRLLAVACDVGRASDVEAMVAAALARFGRIDVLVNNAGYGIRGTIEQTSEADWDALMATNLKGVFLCSRAVVPVMRRQGGGAIVNVASTTAFVGIPERAAYVASKGAVAALTRAMALDHVRDGIRVNAVAPGTVASDYYERILAGAPDPEAMRRALWARQPLGRAGTPEEIASAILYLASEEASFCVGTVLVVDGGMIAW